MRFRSRSWVVEIWIGFAWLTILTMGAATAEDRVPTPDRDLPFAPVGWQDDSGGRWTDDLALSYSDSLGKNVTLDYDVTNGRMYTSLWHARPTSPASEGVRLFRSTTGGYSWDYLDSYYLWGQRVRDADMAFGGGTLVNPVAVTWSNGEHLVYVLSYNISGDSWFASIAFSSFSDSVRSVAIATDYDDYTSTPYFYLVADTYDAIRFWRSSDLGHTWTNEKVLRTGDVRYPDIAYMWDSAGDLAVVYWANGAKYADRNTNFGAVANWIQTEPLGYWADPKWAAIAATNPSIVVVGEGTNPNSGTNDLVTSWYYPQNGDWFSDWMTADIPAQTRSDLTARGGTYRLAYIYQSLGFNLSVSYRPCTENTPTMITWGNAVTVSGHEPASLPRPYGNPCIEGLPGGNTGVVYIADESGLAWFDWATHDAAGVDAPESVSAGSLAEVANPRADFSRLPIRLATDAPVSLTLSDASGRVVDRLFDGWLPAGRHEVGSTRENPPAGIYFLRMQAGGATQTRKITLLR